MPVIEPKGFKALNIFSFQINPHYYNQKQEGFNGETRDQRLIEFIKLNPNAKVIGLPEGSALQMNDGVIKFMGDDPGAIFLKENNNIERKEITANSDLSFLL